MRVIRKQPELNTQRTIKKFAFLPITIGEETRMFEYVEYLEEFINNYANGNHWRKQKFLN